MAAIGAFPTAAGRKTIVARPRIDYPVVVLVANGALHTQWPIRLLKPLVPGDSESAARSPLRKTSDWFNVRIIVGGIGMTRGIGDRCGTQVANWL